MKKIIKRTGLSLLALVGLIIVVPLIYLGITLIRAGGGLPDWDASLEISGLASEIEILRDENAVPHVFADSERDAYFAQGFVHAQDRLWQMLSTRQLLSGRLSEWLGAGALSSDRLNRALRITETSHRDFALLSEEDRALLTAYSDGVNAYLNSSLYRRPPEMVVLHIEPEEWRPQDSVTIARGVYLTLMSGGSELPTQRLTIHGSHPRAVQAADALPLGNVAIIPDSSPGASLVEPVKERAYSDNWVVAGEFTHSGKPLMANDPQLPSTMPNFWYLMHLSIGEQNLVGGTLPGMPSVPVGRNNTLAWGVTNGMVDQLDMMLLYGHEADPDLFKRLPTEEWQRFDTHEEIYQIRFADPHRETIRSTTLGAIIAEDVLLNSVSKEPNTHVEARFVYLDGDTSIEGLLALNRAQNVQDAVDALASFTGPSLNYSLADVEGTIGYVSAGRYSTREGDAATIIDFAPRDSSEWTPIPYDENPVMVAPASGRIVTANQVVAGESYPYYLSDLWAAPFRAMRIHELLDSSPKHDLSTFLAMQRDTLSIPARLMVPLMLAAVPESHSEMESSMLRTLREWDYRFEPDTAASTVFLTWLYVFYEQLARDEIGDVMWPVFRTQPLPPITYQVLEGNRTDWCQTVGKDEPANCEDLLRDSLAIAAIKLETELGPGPEYWRWNDATAMQHPHPLFSALPILGNMFSRTFNYPGGPDTLMVQQVDSSSAPRFTQTFFSSSYQAIYDLADLENSLFMLSTGQSGHYRSPYYDNFLPRFAAGERFEIPTNRSAFEPIAHMQLKPVNQ